MAPSAIDEREDLFLTHQKIAQSLAWKFAEKYARPIEETREIAHDALVKHSCIVPEKFNGKKAQRTTWIYQKIYFGLLSHCFNKKPWEPLRPTEEMHNFEQHSSGWLEEVLMDLEDEGRVLIHVLLEAPGELRERITLMRAASVRQHVAGYLRRRAAWDDVQFQRAWEQVAGVLRGYEEPDAYPAT